MLAAFLKPRMRAADEVLRQTFVANPFDSDWMNSTYAGGFLTYADAARWGFIIRMGFFGLSLRKRWWTILGGQKIIHRRPVKIFRRVQLEIQLAGWDEK